MALSKALSCPIKLPPLDGSRFSPAELNAKPDSKSDASGINTTNKTTSFNNILARAKASKQAAAHTNNTDRAKEAGREVESFFLSYVFKQAFNNRVSSGLFGDSYASRMFLEMFIDAAADEAAKSTPLGIADMIVLDINRKRQSEREESDETQKLHGVR